MNQLPRNILNVRKAVQKYLSSSEASCLRKLQPSERCYAGAASRGFPPPPLSPQRRVVVTGLGLVTPLARGVIATWQRLVDGECGVRKVTAHDIALSWQSPEEAQELWRQLPSKVAAFVPRGTGPTEFDEDKILGRKEQRRIALFIAFAQLAAKEALEDAKWTADTHQRAERTGVAIGGGIGCIGEIVDAAKLVIDQKIRRLSPFFVPKILINMASGYVSIDNNCQGPNHAAVTACASGAHSVGDAARMIKYGDADVMLAGGSESCIDALSIAGFCRLRALSTSFNDSPCAASRPFDHDRDGFVIGEGAGVLVLEELEHARARGAKMYAEVRGYGMSGDAYHITQPSAEGRGAYLAMESALRNSGLTPEDIDYVNAHATSTPLGDDIEARAILRLFGAHAESGNMALSSTKGATGHLLGAAGAVEAVFTVLAVAHAKVPPTINLERPDLIFTDAFRPTASTLDKPIRAALTNSFGFGGTNASLIFTQPPD
ncbi:3-ketoacyl-acyl carrier protein synthase [Klebsormidium nitens]|uniref:3-oxoacyl-[acyl-carrier-protein] synthase, mitochondrial n=1 Tax=Klebsormidium nitens TaxID=105231 RepID=A0A1Y1HS27_KLENI|nr:3-ketoacyl-acyl carrier protein synthase [Klebsormidium nitens]|eukprot:GAQ81434.1 3-ketoacyl-acyl carrier protein synthase [Klebsormidium nitens]